MLEVPLNTSSEFLETWFMESGILPPQLRTIEQLFTGDTRLSVPPYQRNFAWGKDEVEELWEDILSAVDRKSDYFLGTIVVQEKGKNKFEIIDGQQRLTCLTMMFSAIRNAFKTNQDSSRAEQISTNFLGARGYSRDAIIEPKLVLNKNNNEVFVRHIIESDNLANIKVASRGKKSTESNKLLLEAYAFFLEKILGRVGSLGTQSDEFIVPLIDTLRSSVKLITITVMSGEDANLFFESLNARGKELAVSDLVKNRLFIEAGDQVVRAQSIWEKMETELIRRSLPEYLRHFWIAKKADSGNLIVREKQLYRLIAANVKNNPSNAIDLLMDFETSAHDYIKINDYNLWPDEDAYDREFEMSIDDLKLFRVTQCYPLLLNAIQVFDSPKNVTSVFRTVVNFSFRYFIIGNQSPGNLERETNKIAHGIRTGMLSSAKEVADAFRGINPDSTFRSDFSLATLTKARSKIARYMLGKLNNYLARQASGEEIVNPDAKQVNLEHVLPQSIPGAWTTHFSKSADPADYVYRIGNLTLLNRKINSNAGDQSFSDKRDIAFMPSSLPINQHFQSVNRWGEQEIEQRQNELAKIAVQVWSL